MNILALDTATEVFSVALSTEAGNWYTEIDCGSGAGRLPRHSELLMECVDGLFKLAMFTPKELNRIACMKGPGSFTGLRIGFSTAKGLAMALGIPLIPVPTLDCIAATLSIWPGIIVPLIDAKKGAFFSALYRGHTRLTDYLDISPENLALRIEKARISTEEKIVLTGPGADLFFSNLPSILCNDKIVVSGESKSGRARELLKMAKSIKIKNGMGFSSDPLYIRKSDAELSRD